MSLASRFAPPTQLDALRALLSEYSDGDVSFQGQFEKSLQTLRQLALPELGQRLARNTTAIGLRRKIIQAAKSFDWPEWDKHLVSALQQEEDLLVFKEGCAALGGLCTKGALEGLRRLKKARQDAERQEILDHELGRYETDHSFASCLDVLMGGQSTPEMARQGARWVVNMAGPSDLDALMEAFHLGDSLTCHLILRVLAFIQDSVSDTLLLTLFHDAKLESFECGPFAEFATQLEGQHGKARRELVLEKARAHFKNCTSELVQGLHDLINKSSNLAVPDLDPLRIEARGPLKAFLFKALQLMVQGKSMGFDTLVRESIGSLPSLHAAYMARMDDLAGLLAAKVDQKQLTLEQVLPLLEDAFHAPAGGDGLLVAYLRLIPISDQARMDRILFERDEVRRKRCIEILGAREDDGLAPFFVQAMKDPVKEVAQLAMHQLSKLPSGLPGMMELFRSTDTAAVRESIHFFSENQTKEAVKALMGFLSSEASDDLLVDAASALGTIRDPASTNALLRQLHAGKPLALQATLIEALTQIGTPAASLGILKKSEELTLPEVLLLALKGSLAAFPGFDQPFPSKDLKDLEHLVERCCDAREGAGHWLEAALIMQDLYAFDAGVYDRLIDLFTTFLVDQAQRSRKSHELLSEVIKKLTRRGASLSTLEEREKALQASIEAIPESGPKRMQTLYRLKEILSDPEHALGEACSKLLVEFISRELLREDLDFDDVETLSKIAGLSGQTGMIEPLEDLFAHAKTKDVQGAARRALLKLGLTEKDIETRKPIQSILLFEPNTFFRNRLASAMEGLGRSLFAVATRQEAQAILVENKVDLVISESHDEMGALWLWLAAKWEQRRMRYLILSSSSHDLGPLATKPWVIGRFYKPYPLEELIKAIEE